MTTQAPVPVQKPSRLAAVTRGRIAKPLRIVLVGVDGIGKSTFASNAPSPIFIGAEDGTANLDVHRMPAIESWTDIVESAAELATGEHDYKTLVLDTADWAEPKCWEHVARVAGKKSIEDLPYGKGYVAALDEWRILLAQFERARAARGMAIIILAHSWIKLFKNPEEGGDFDRYEMKLHAKASGLLKEWADCVLFATYETFAVTKENRTKGVSTGARVIHTQRRAAWDAKNRFGLPEVMPLDWATFEAAVAANGEDAVEALRVEIDKALAGLDDEFAAKVKAWLPTAKSGSELAQGLERIRGHVMTTVQK